jgi:hypothetical protein
MSLATGPEAGQVEDHHSCDRHPNEWPIVVSYEYIHQITNDVDEEDSYRQRDAPTTFHTTDRWLPKRIQSRSLT